MKRRKFLGLFGGAIAAPLMPMPTLAAAAPAGYSQAALHGAILHAQSRSSFSVWGLAKTLNVPTAQAEALMGDLAQRGVLGPLQGTTFGGRWAKSNVLMREHLGLAKVAQKQMRRGGFGNGAGQGVDVSDMMAHLRKMADRYFATKNRGVSA